MSRLTSRGDLPLTEVVHWLDGAAGDRLTSYGNTFSLVMGGRSWRFTVPVSPPDRWLSGYRIARRALRLDKSNAVLTAGRDAVVVLYRGGMWRYELQTNSLACNGRLRQCRNVLHQGVTVLDDGSILFGEYGANKARESVPIWRSRDGGRSWHVVFEFPAGSIKHVHGVHPDPYTGRLWLPTGDFDGECHLVVADREFSDVIWLGDGSQTWRTVNLYFRPDRVSWSMDSQLETSFFVTMDRLSGQLERGRDFPGPIWYSKELNDGIVLAQTTAEVGAGVKDARVHLFASRDLQHWVEVGVWEKDWWSMRLFKFGVIGFADGPQDSSCFAMFGEALRGFDGRAGLFALDLDG